jgi:hypothetical protein
MEMVCLVAFGRLYRRGKIRIFCWWAGGGTFSGYDDFSVKRRVPRNSSLDSMSRVSVSSLKRCLLLRKMTSKSSVFWYEKMVRRLSQSKPVSILAKEKKPV